MTWKIPFLALFLPVVAIAYVVAKRYLDADTAKFLARYPDWYVDLSPFDHSVIAIRRDGHKAMFGKPGKTVQVDIADIVSVEVLRNGESLGMIQRGRRSPDIALPDILPAASYLTSITFKVTMDRPSQRVETMTFLLDKGKGLESGTPRVNQSVEKADYWFGLLNARMAALSPSSPV